MTFFCILAYYSDRVESLFNYPLTKLRCDNRDEYKSAKFINFVKVGKKEFSWKGMDYEDKSNVTIIVI